MSHQSVVVRLVIASNIVANDPLLQKRPEPLFCVLPHHVPLRASLVVRTEFSPGDLDETIRLFQGLIRIDTTNPPGNEGKAAEYLKTHFDSNGIDCEVLGEPGRENVMARISGQRERPRLLFEAHTDVVPATGVGTWTHPPFSGEIADKWIYGRGAWDDKFDVAVQAMSLILLKRQNVRLNGTLLYAAVADEEGLGSGAAWLTKKVPEKVAAECVVGEGGAPPIQLGREKVYWITTGEKGLAWFKLTAKGKAGHGSVPTLAQNASVMMAKAFINLSNFKTKVTIIDDVAHAIRVLTMAFLGEKEGSKIIGSQLNEQGIDRILDTIASKDKEAAEELRALTRMTISPNVIKGGTETNVIPGICEGKVDIRLLPGQNRDYATQVVKECVRGLDIDLDVVDYTDASLSPSNTDFYRLIEATVEELAPGCSTLPRLSTGMSDSRFWRALGSIAYGCVPMSPDITSADVSPGVHGANERMNIESLEFATKFLCNVAVRILS
jgi:acetylornithine deacetylase/succinyl-diaminopimelate desuccinylase-like protein